MEDLSVYREVFIEEMVDQLGHMERVLLTLEKDTSEELIQSLFRAAHTIKGSSASMGFEEMKSLTHEMEHLLDQVRGGTLEVNGSLINLLFEALDGLKLLRDQYMKEVPYSDMSQLVHMLQKLGKGTQVLKKKVRDLPEITLEQSQQMAESREAGLNIVKVYIRLTDGSIMKAARFYLISQELADKFGSIIVSQPPKPDNQELEDEKANIETSCVRCWALNGEQRQRCISSPVRMRLCS
jgi:two-component system chemotaxis sensor kinase CheA